MLLLKIFVSSWVENFELSSCFSSIPFLGVSSSRSEAISYAERRLLWEWISFRWLHFLLMSWNRRSNFCGITVLANDQAYEYWKCYVTKIYVKCVLIISSIQHKRCELIICQNNILTSRTFFTSCGCHSDDLDIEEIPGPVSFPETPVWNFERPYLTGHHIFLVQEGITTLFGLHKLWELVLSGDTSCCPHFLNFMHFCNELLLHSWQCLCVSNAGWPLFSIDPAISWFRLLAVLIMFLSTLFTG